MRRITGTHVHGFVTCPRRVALDFALPRSERRALRPEEEFVRQRGRDHEAVIVAALGWPEPDYPERDFTAGAAATERLCSEGVPGVVQGVLLGRDRLGIPDLLRREPGASRFGDWHYVPGDVKSSRAPRSDQVLQVAFYGELLADLQGRRPEYGYLVLKDGREERFPLAPYRAALAQVLEGVAAARAGPDGVRPFRSAACEKCHWSHVCLPELRAADDLSLVDGMTPGARAMLERAGFRTAAELARSDPWTVARATRLERALVERLGRAAAAHATGHPLRETTPATRIAPAAFVHLLTDPFEERVLFAGALVPGCEPEFRGRAPRPGEEGEVLCALLEGIPADHLLVHYGAALPVVYERHAARADGATFEERFADLRKRLRGAATWPSPVFGLADHVEQGLGRDPHREGRSDAAAWHATGPDGEDWLRAKCAADLADLRDLTERWLARPAPARPAALAAGRRSPEART